MTGDLQGQVAIVTGSGRGIGRGIAELFAEHGAAVVVATRTERTGQEVVDGITAAGGRAALFATDLADEAAAAATVAFTAERFGALDIVVHNAALPWLRAVEEMTDEVLDATFSLNIKAGVWLTRHALPHMREAGRGRLLFTSSITARRAIRGASAYAASKAGLHGWIRSAAYELGQYGITVNGVEPGMIWTDAMDKHSYSDEEVAQIVGGIPLGRPGTPRDVAAAMVFLASPGAAYITGQTIVVDGGMLLPESAVLTMQGR